MYVYVLNKEGRPLMPCKPVIARLLLKEGKASVKCRTPFIIKLLVNSTEYTQPVIAGMDTGSVKIGCAAIANGKVVYQSEVGLRQDVSKKMRRRGMYRRNRRGRKTRYRKPRWLNRASMRNTGRLAPSIKSKLDSHLKERRFVESILPVLHWKVETASFDIHKITNLGVEGKGYQEGEQKGYYNTKAYVLHRDNYKCQSGRKDKHSQKLHVHHKVFKSKGGTDAPSNLITLCETCHSDLHVGVFEIKGKQSKTKHATEVSIINAQLKKQWQFEETFGYETKFKRERILQLPKTHYYDSVAICCEDGELIEPLPVVYYKRHVGNGDYQQTKGTRSEKAIPTGKLFGLRKHDFIKTIKGTGFIKGKRSSGYFALENILGEKIHTSVNIKKGVYRISARTTTLVQIMETAIPPLS